MDYARANLGPDFAHDGGTFLMALSIRDSQVPVPTATEVCGGESVGDVTPLSEAGLVEKILAAACLAIAVVFVVVVLRGL